MTSRKRCLHCGNPKLSEGNMNCCVPQTQHQSSRPPLQYNPSLPPQLMLPPYGQSLLSRPPAVQHYPQMIPRSLPPPFMYSMHRGSTPQRPYLPFLNPQQQILRQPLMYPSQDPAMLRQRMYFPGYPPIGFFPHVYPVTNLSVAVPQNVPTTSNTFESSIPSPIRKTWMSTSQQDPNANMPLPNKFGTEPSEHIIQVSIDNVTPGIRVRQLQKLLVPYGRLIDCVILQNNLGLLFIELENRDVDSIVRELTSLTLDGRILTIKDVKLLAPTHDLILVKNLSSHVMVADLCHICRPYGTVIDCFITPTGGYIRIILAKERNVREIVEALTGLEIHSKSITVEAYSKVFWKPLLLDGSSQCTYCGNSRHLAKDCTYWSATDTCCNTESPSKSKSSCQKLL